MIGSRHHKIMASDEYFKDLLDDFCWYGDLPWSVPSGLGVLAVSKAASELGIKVLLNGDGADEAFGGYSWYKYLTVSRDSTAYDVSHSINFNNIGLSVDDRVSMLNKMSGAQRGYAWHYYASEAEKQKLFSSEVQHSVETSIRFFEGLNLDNEPIDYIKHDRNFYFPFEMLRKADRMTMAYSVEGRTPFASKGVQALSNRLSYSDMVKGGTLKWMLRDAFSDILPMHVINRPKHGFNVPIDYWLNNKWSYMIEEAFCDGSLLHQYNIIGKKAYEEAVKMVGNYNSRLNGSTVFSFIMLNKWLEN